MAHSLAAAPSALRSRATKVRDVFLVSAVWSLIALLIFAANAGRTREKNAIAELFCECK
jgi:hypothetical protein